MRLTRQSYAQEAAQRLEELSTGIIRDTKPLESDAENPNSAEDPSLVRNYRSHLQDAIDAGNLMPLNYRQLVPEVLPDGYADITFQTSLARKRTVQVHHLARRLSPFLTVEDVAQIAQSCRLKTVLDVVKKAWPIFPRLFTPRPLSVSSDAPPICCPRSDANAWNYAIPPEVLELLAKTYLSYADVRHLRLVDKGMSLSFSPIYFRNLVTRFGPGMFAPLQRFRDSANKFGISFEIDLPALLILLASWPHPSLLPFASGA